jgi:hypothetical protein
LRASSSGLVFDRACRVARHPSRLTQSTSDLTDTRPLITPRPTTLPFSTSSRCWSRRRHLPHHHPHRYRVGRAASRRRTSPIPAAGTTTTLGTTAIEHERRCAFKYTSASVANSLRSSRDGNPFTARSRCGHKHRYAWFRPQPPLPGPTSRIRMRYQHSPSSCPRHKHHITMSCG